MDTTPVLIVGAGLAGLVAAGALQQAGRRVLVLDKASEPGGRLATRRVSTADGAMARFDHGAQFFTVRDPDFADLAHEWRRAGLVREWCKGFGPGGDGYPRYVIEGGMNSLAKYLASTLDVECDVLVDRVADHGGAMIAVCAGDRNWHANEVVLTPPTPQALVLAGNGRIQLGAHGDALRAVRYAPCLALLVVLHGESSLPDPGAIQGDPTGIDTFSFVADNSRKGISDATAVTLHCTDIVSAARFDDDPGALLADLVAAGSSYWRGAQVVSAQLKKWRFARPLIGHPADHVAFHTPGGALLVFAGDAFGGAKMEGAALSGLAAARAVLGG